MSQSLAGLYQPCSQCDWLRIASIASFSILWWLAFFMYSWDIRVTEHTEDLWHPMESLPLYATLRIIVTKRCRQDELPHNSMDQCDLSVSANAIQVFFSFQLPVLTHVANSVVQDVCMLYLSSWLRKQNRIYFIHEIRVGAGIGRSFAYATCHISLALFLEPLITFS